MIPGEIQTLPGEIELNAGRDTIEVKVVNTGDRPVQVGSHYHFAEVNPALQLDREQARGFRLDIPAGTAVRFEPGQQRVVTLVALAGKRRVYGFRGEVMGPLEGEGGESSYPKARKTSGKSANKKAQSGTGAAS